MTNKPLFLFNTQVVSSDPTGYYMTRWDNAHPVIVVASTRYEAIKKVKDMMGDPPFNRAWAVSIDSVEELVNDNQ